MCDIKDIIKINREIVHEDGTIDSFDKQILNLISGNFDVNNPLIINSNTSFIDYVDKVNTNYPLIMNVSTFIKLQNKHSISLSLINDVETLLKNSVLAFESLTENESVIFLTDRNNNLNDDPYIITCRYDKKIGTYQVNEITSIYDKQRFRNFLIRIYEDDKMIYKNKKTEQYFNLNRLQLPRNLHYALSTMYNKPFFNKSQVENELNLCDDLDIIEDKDIDITSNEIKYYCISVTFDDGESDYYEIAIENAKNVHEAIEIAKENGYFRSLDDMNCIDSVCRVTYDEYLDIVEDMDDFNVNYSLNKQIHHAESINYEKKEEQTVNNLVTNIEKGEEEL